MSGSTRSSPELRERAVRMVIDNREDYPSEWAALTGISKLFGMSAETLRTWVRRTQVDTGSRPGLTTDERARLKQLERENKDLKRANAILKDASIFFATELGGQTRGWCATPTLARVNGESSRSAESCSSPPARTTPRGAGA